MLDTNDEDYVAPELTEQQIKQAAARKVAADRIDKLGWQIAGGSEPNMMVRRMADQMYSKGVYDLNDLSAGPDGSFINKRTNETIDPNHFIEVGDESGTHYFSFTPEGLSHDFTPYSHGSPIGQAIRTLGSIIPSPVQPIFAAYNALDAADKGNYGQALATILPGALEGLAGGTDLLSNLGGAGVEDLNLLAKSPAGQMVEAGTGVAGNTADIIGKGIQGGVSASLTGQNVLAGAVTGALGPASASNVEIGNTDFSVGDAVKAARIATILGSNNPDYGAAASLAGQLANSQNLVLAGRAGSFLEAINSKDPGRIFSTGSALKDSATISYDNYRRANPNSLRGDEGTDIPAAVTSGNGVDLGVDASVGAAGVDQPEAQTGGAPEQTTSSDQTTAAVDQATPPAVTTTEQDFGGQRYYIYPDGQVGYYDDNGDAQYLSAGQWATLTGANDTTDANAPTGVTLATVEIPGQRMDVGGVTFYLQDDGTGKQRAADGSVVDMSKAQVDELANQAASNIGLNRVTVSGNGERIDNAAVDVSNETVPTTVTRQDDPTGASLGTVTVTAKRLDNNDVSAVDSVVGSTGSDTVTLMTTGAVSVSSIDTAPVTVHSDTVTLLGSGSAAAYDGSGSSKPNDADLPIRKVGDLGKYVSPLAGYQDLVQKMYNTAMDEKAQQQQPMPYQQQDENSYWDYGQQEKTLESMFGALGEAIGGKEVKAATGGSIAALMAAGGASKTGRGSSALVPHSGKLRVDFRRGDAVTGPGDGQSDDIPAMLADGEFVFPADVVSALGNGSTKAGSDRLYDMMHAIRARARKAPPKALPPPAKSPLEYLRGKK